MNTGSKVKIYTVEKRTGVTFRDVAGQGESKESLGEMVNYLKHHFPQAFGARQQ